MQVGSPVDNPDLSYWNSLQTIHEVRNCVTSEKNSEWVLHGEHAADTERLNSDHFTVPSYLWITFHSFLRIYKPNTELQYNEQILGPKHSNPFYMCSQENVLSDPKNPKRGFFNNKSYGLLKVREWVQETNREERLQYISLSNQITMKWRWNQHLT